MRFYWLVLAILVVWRLTYLLQAENGPWDMVVRLRRAAGSGFWGDVLDCFNCLSLWIALPFAWVVGDGVLERLLLWPALSGGAILLHRATGGDAEPMPVVYYEQSQQTGDHDALLRTEKTEGPGKPSERP